MESDIIRIAVCDDEKAIAEKIVGYIGEYINKTKLPYKIDIYQSGEEFVSLKSAMKQYDIVFLDVSMREMDGIKTAHELRKYSDRTYIIFVTGFIEYSLAGYKVNAVRYIIKDKDTIEADITEALNAVFEKLGKNTDETIYDFVEEKSKRVVTANIMYIENSLHRISFHFNENGTENIYTVYKKMDDIEMELKAEELVRVHQSFIVNMKYVCDIKRYYVKLINSVKIPISKQRYKNAVLEYARQKGAI
ncbi:LytTR family DNA-binding domain-containing protein [Eubacterium sp. MSJ-13]|uniref:LytR/AlgR family response regulator transcription factor n=1 Tax=Eubacterium sp. MSJ-13 TaxID=2841513 RepID=UPI001C0F4796|nr:LytTR family DNA-binding domain-containing protein [Eubacterium sp. MSJ-13]MBU5478287.1 LytTR family DNA-binding domain-containing protein [Eubacterium sp. MSJ-13]